MNYQKKVKNLSNGTIKTYHDDLQDFVTWAQAHNLTWRTTSKADIEAYQMSMAEAGLKPATRAKRTSTLRNIFRYMQHRGLRADNPAQYAQAPKIAKTMPEMAKMEDIRAYLAAPTTTRREEEMKALVALLVSTGLRIEEALNIKAWDINKEERSIKVTGKGSKDRKVFYTGTAAAYLNAYARGHRDYIFEHREQEEVRMTMIETTGKYIERAHPHMFRHTYATIMLARGCDIKILATLLGHESVKTTERYAKVMPTLAMETAKAVRVI